MSLFTKNGLYFYQEIVLTSKHNPKPGQCLKRHCKEFYLPKLIISYVGAFLYSQTHKHAESFFSVSWYLTLLHTQYVNMHIQRLLVQVKRWTYLYCLPFGQKRYSTSSHATYILINPYCFLCSRHTTSNIFVKRKCRPPYSLCHKSSWAHTHTPVDLP